MTLGIASRGWKKRTEVETRTRFQRQGDDHALCSASPESNVTARGGQRLVLEKAAVDFPACARTNGQVKVTVKPEAAGGQ